MSNPQSTTASPYAGPLVLHITKRPLLPARFAHCTTRTEVLTEANHLLLQLARTEHDSDFYDLVSSALHAIDAACERVR